MIKKHAISTGIPALDDSLAKLHSGDLVILVAQPDTDKSGLIVDIAINAMQKNLPVAVFSSETADIQFHEKMLLTLSGINNCDLQPSDVQPEHWDMIANAISQLTDHPVYIDDTPNITVSDMEKAIRCTNEDPENDNIGLVVIDNLRLMSGEKQAQEVLRALKAMAKELTLTVIAISPQTAQPDLSSTVQIDAVISV